jgi:aminoglycoside phosphotransferase (APT) family kinase protein
MARMHVDDIEIDVPLVRRLLAEQFPEWAGLPLSLIEPSGTDNAVFRLGEELSIRLARRNGPTEAGGKELEWLPRLAPLVPFEIPVPVAQAARRTSTRGSGTCTPGSRARRCRSRRSTRSRRPATSRRWSSRCK